MAKRKCVGFKKPAGLGGTTIKKCDRPPGKNPYWCDPCNNKRIAHINKQFNEVLVKRFAG